MFRFQKFIKREDLRANPDVLYLFGDNCDRVGFGGQAAEMRGSPNAVGVRTKKHPSMEDSAFFTDDEFESNRTMLINDLTPVWKQLEDGGDVVCPMDGLGTGLSALQAHAPKTADYLLARIRDLVNTYGVNLNV